MNVREKLVELLKTNACPSPFICDQACKYYGYGDCFPDRYADHLISNGVTVQEWIPVTERLPDNKEHDWVLAQVVEDNGFMHIPKVMEYRQQRNDWLDETYGWLSEHNGAFTVTHWMPLPAPPKGE